MDNSEVNQTPDEQVLQSASDAAELKSVLGDVEPPKSENELAVSDEIITDEVEQPTITRPIVPSETPTDANGELQHLLSQFKNVADTVLNNYNADRNQIEGVIQFLDQMVQMGPKTPRVYVEMLVAALRTKTETNTNAVKLLDSLAKLLSAGKGTSVFVNQGQSFDSSDLKKLLDAPAFPDEM